jgi:hypothetical protein
MAASHQQRYYFNLLYLYLRPEHSEAVIHLKITYTTKKRGTRFWIPRPLFFDPSSPKRQAFESRTSTQVGDT